MNDPNGPIWWKGKYHLFYQLNPHAAVWGDMHWGHAISTDMVHWHHEPIALAPTPGGPDSEGCFSGSAVVLDGVPTFIYTGVQNAPPNLVTRFATATTNCARLRLLATAEDDDLLHWKKLADACHCNAASKAWSLPASAIHASGGRRCLVPGNRIGRARQRRLRPSLSFTATCAIGSICTNSPRASPTAKWRPIHATAGRCGSAPTSSQLNGRHCLLYSTEDKVIWTTGDYDAQSSIAIPPKRQGILDHGAYYAPKSFLAPDGRRILWGWIRETRPEKEFAAAGWSGAMSLPRVLTVGSKGQLQIDPAVEVEKLRGSSEQVTLKPDVPYQIKPNTLRRELNLPIALSKGTSTVRLLTGGKKVWEITIDVSGNTVRCGEKEFPLPSLPWPRPNLRMFLDGSVIESFIGGREAITSRVYDLKPGDTQLEIAAHRESTPKLSHWPLNAISADRLTT